MFCLDAVASGFSRCKEMSYANVRVCADRPPCDLGDLGSLGKSGIGSPASGRCESMCFRPRIRVCARTSGCFENYLIL